MPFGTVNQGSEFTVTWSSGHARGRIVYSLVLGAAIRDDQYATEHGPIGSDRSRESRESIVGRCRCSVRHAPRSLTCVSAKLKLCDNVNLELTSQ